MATQTARGPGSRQPYVETESEASDVFTDSDEDNSEEDEDEEDEEDDEAPVSMSTPANVGTKRSDPSIVQKKNKYATSDSGYSSLTATTASSSQSKKAAAQPSKTEKLKQSLANAFSLPTRPAAQTRPLASRRQSQRLERTTRDLRSVESREDAARMSLTGASTRASAGRRPSMPGGYPPSPTKTTYAITPAPMPAAPRPVPRPRASTNTQQTGGQRPQSYHAGSAPGNGIIYQLAPVQQGQHFVIAQQQQPYYQGVPQQTTQPLQINTAGYYSGSWGSQHGYIPTPTSATATSAYPSNYPHPYNQNPQAMHHQMQQQMQHQAQPQPPSQPQHQPYPWPGPSGSYNGGYSGALGDFHDQYSRRMSINNSSNPYQQGMGSYYSEVQPPHYPSLRRMSQSVQHHAPMFQPPPRTPVDEGVFLDDDDDNPDNFYRGFQHAVEREMMPPPPRPQSSHRPRPPMVHARTTSAAHAHRLSRGSMEYRDYAEVSPRKASFEGRPPSRPGMPQRMSSGSARALIHAQAEPQSPLRMRHRKGSTYGHGELEPILQAAEAYQHERTGGFGSSFATDDLPPLSKRQTKTSDTGSRGSKGSGSRENGDKKRSNRHSLDRSKLRDGSDPGVQLSIGTVRLDVKGGTTMTIKHSQEAMKALPAPPVSRPSSTKPTREQSRVRAERPETKRYISATNSSRSSNKERAEVEVARKRRSSSVQPRIGRDEGGRDLADSIARLRLENDSRQSRRSSRSGRAPTDR